MDFWSQLLWTLLTSSAFGAFLIYMGKRFINLSFDKSLEEYKNQIKVISDQSYYRFSIYHSKKVETLGELYGLLQNAHLAIENLTRLVKFSTGKSLDEEKKETAEPYNKLVKYFLTRRIYLDTEICTLFDELLKLYKEALIEFDTATFEGKYERDDEAIRLRKKSWETISEKIPPLLASIEHTFRKEIIENPSET